MRKLILCALTFLLSACVGLTTTNDAGETVLDLPRAHAQLDLIEQDAADLATVFDATNPDLAERIRAIGRAFGLVDDEIERMLAGENATLDASVSSALELLDALVDVAIEDPEEAQAWNAYIVGARFLLRRIAAATATASAAAAPET